VTLEAQLVVSAYTPDQVEIGRQRYADPAEPGGLRVACADCHETGAGPDHSPTTMAFHDDQALLLLTLMGRYPDFCADDEGDACECDTAGCEREPGLPLEIAHSWELTTEEEDGIAAYMRSLPAAGF
jgi:hypothetical protein